MDDRSNRELVLTENITLASGVTISNIQTPPVDPKERKRQRARERYAQMPDQKKAELLKRRREACQQKKDAMALVNQTQQKPDTSREGDRTLGTEEVCGQDSTLDCRLTPNCYVG